MSLDIRGCLTNWKDRDMRGMFKHDDGREMDPREAKAVLLDELAKGHRVLPVGDECPAFDYQTGCPGHERPNIDAAIAERPTNEGRTDA